MFLNVMKSKIHNAIITKADINYEGSITIDEELMEKSNIYAGERVQVVNMENGNRLETYVITGKRGSKCIEMNGPAALKCTEGQRIHIITYAFIEPQEMPLKPVNLFIKNMNDIKNIT